MTGRLRIELTRYAVDSIDDRESGKDRRVEIVTEIKAKRAKKCLVMHPQPDGVGNVVEVTLCIGRLVQTEIGVLLLPSEKVVDHVARLREHISHIVKDRETDVVLDERQIG